MTSSITTTDSIKTGKVAWFNSFRGFGFITIDDGSGDVYVHQSNINMEGFRKLEEGATVQFQVGIDNSERGGGKAYAFDVTSLSAGDSDGGEDDETANDGDADKKADDVEVTAESEKAEEAEENEKAQVIETVSDASEPAVGQGSREEAPKPKPTPVDGTDDSLDEGEKAFNILVSLGMVEMTPDPDDDSYDGSKDEDFAPHTTI